MKHFGPSIRRLTAARGVEGSRAGVVLEDPQMQRRGADARRRSISMRFVEQARADPLTLEVGPDVKIVEQRSPRDVRVAQNAREAEQIMSSHSFDHKRTWSGAVAKAVTPEGHPV